MICGPAMGTSDFLFDGPEGSAHRLVLAHGAGAPMDSPFMAAFAEGLGGRGIRAARFEFPYMRKRRAGGGKRPPDRAPALRQSWLEAIAALGGGAGLVIGGKSMGGRIASLLADEAGVRGLVCLGYPFHPPGRPERTRVEHLAALQTPTLMVQGARDSLGNRGEVAGYALAAAIGLLWLEDGDHGFRPRKASGLSERENWDRGIAGVAEFVLGL